MIYYNTTYLALTAHVLFRTRRQLHSHRFCKTRCAHLRLRPSRPTPPGATSNGGVKRSPFVEHLGAHLPDSTPRHRRIGSEHPLRPPLPPATSSSRKARPNVPILTAGRSAARPLGRKGGADHAVHSGVAPHDGDRRTGQNGAWPRWRARWVPVCLATLPGCLAAGACLAACVGQIASERK